MLTPIRRLTRARALRLGLSLALWVVGHPLPAQAQDTTPSGTSTPLSADAALEQVPELIKLGEYDRAIALLRPAIASASANERYETLREAYLLLIKTYVLRSNFYQTQPDLEAARLYIKEARAVTLESLQIDALRETYPDDPREYPPEMFRLFDEARCALFGTLRVTTLTPADATVVVDGDTLSAAPGETVLEQQFIPAGAHKIVVLAAGHKTLAETFEVAPCTVHDKLYTLQKRRGWGWWLTVGGTAAASAAGAVVGLLSIGGGDSTPAPEPLPGPPAPP